MRDPFASGENWKLEHKTSQLQPLLTSLGHSKPIPVVIVLELFCCVVCCFFYGLQVGEVILGGLGGSW